MICARRHRSWLVFSVLLGLASCKAEVEVYAPPIEAYYVVGVLDPARDTNYVRLSRVFQSPGDAYAYADTADLNVRGWDVQIRGGGRTWQAIELQMPKEPGMFASTNVVYAFHTGGGARLSPGTRYDLHMRKPGDSISSISAWTEIPTEPVLLSPGAPVYHAPTHTYSYQSFEFSEDVDLHFEQGSGIGFEARVYATYWAGDTPHELCWGPTDVRQTPVRCAADLWQGKMCIELGGGSVPNYFRSQVNFASGPVAMHDTIKVAQSLDSLSRVARVEITAVDSFLTQYLIGNSSFGYGLNLLMDKREYSNISSDNYGIFGSIHSSSRWIFLGGCTKFLSGFTPSGPPGCR